MVYRIWWIPIAIQRPSLARTESVSIGVPTVNLDFTALRVVTYTFSCAPRPWNCPVVKMYDQPDQCIADGVPSTVDDKRLATGKHLLTSLWETCRDENNLGTLKSI